MLQNTKPFILFISAYLLGSLGYAQTAETFSCGLPNKLEKLYEAYPGLKEDQQRLIEKSKQVYTTAGGDREAIYVIPVVFHVLHQNGVENISDAQIYDQMAILNQDFQKQNTDTVDIVETFQPFAGNARIEFRLANKDPYGNCTNGIEHVYSHETNQGDDFSKLHQWPRSRYLNVWIVNDMEGGVAGYSYYPSAVDGGLKFADGVIIRHNFIGSIGTSSAYTSRALTHEIGHWLGLPHTWGSTNSPEVACGNDGIDDTPITAGHASCILEDTDNCVEGQEENVQNFMEYSYCSNMFTNGQIAVMHTALENIESARNNLHTAATLENTGIDDAPSLCTPLPDFFAANPIICEGKNIQFYASISRAEVDSYFWSFPGGSPATSTEADPDVTYNTAGIHPVTLTVTNGAGSETVTKTEMVHVMADYWQYEGPYFEDFENDHFDTDGWMVVNPENDTAKWDLFENAGYSGNQCLGVNYYQGIPDPLINPFYYERLGGIQDILISPSFNLNNTEDIALNFKFAFATFNPGLYSDENLQLKISYWKECDNNWIPLTIINGDDMFCDGYYGEAFLANNSSNWQDVSISLPEAAKTTHVRFKIELTAADFMNNFFLDDFHVSGILSSAQSNEGIQQVYLFPNPGKHSENIYLQFTATSATPILLSAYDLIGNQVMQQEIQPIVGLNKLTFETSAFRHSGVYLIELQHASGTVTKKLIIQ
jgi:PKD repeat protein